MNEDTVVRICEVCGGVRATDQKTGQFHCEDCVKLVRSIEEPKKKN